MVCQTASCNQCEKQANTDFKILIEGDRKYFCSRRCRSAYLKDKNLSPFKAKLSIGLSSTTVLISTVIEDFTALEIAYGIEVTLARKESFSMIRSDGIIRIFPYEQLIGAMILVENINPIYEVTQ